MKDHVGTAQQRLDFLVTPDVGPMDFDAAVQAVQILRAAGGEIVHDDDFARAFGEESADQSRTDEAGSPGDDVAAHRRAISASKYRSESVAIFSAPKLKSKHSSEIQPAYPRRLSTRSSGLKS